MDTFEVGGNSFFVFTGKVLDSMGEWFSLRGKNLSNKNKPLTVSNPAAKLVNPFTLIVTFTVNISDKYQVVLQGDYKQKYREINDDNIIVLSDAELHNIIVGTRKIWFKKE